MKVTINVPEYGLIGFEESAWTGRKTLLQNGKECAKLGKNKFVLENGETAEGTGNFLRGAALYIHGKQHQLTPAAKWYEYMLAALPLLFNLIWGNVVALFEIFPVVGGAIGGAIGGVCLVLSLVLMRKTNKWWAKILIGLAAFAVSVLISYGVALLFLSAV